MGEGRDLYKALQNAVCGKQEDVGAVSCQGGWGVRGTVLGAVQHVKQEVGVSGAEGRDHQSCRRREE